MTPKDKELAEEFIHRCRTVQDSQYVGNHPNLVENLKNNPDHWTAGFIKTNTHAGPFIAMFCKVGNFQIDENHPLSFSGAFLDLSLWMRIRVHLAAKKLAWRGSDLHDKFAEMNRLARLNVAQAEARAKHSG